MVQGGYAANKLLSFPSASIPFQLSSIRFRSVKAVDEAVAAELLIHSAKSDNTDLFRNLAKSIGAVALQDECHGQGEANI